MKKIMFNDDLGLTKSVLLGLKIQTRRVVPQNILDKIEQFGVEYYNATLDQLTTTELLEQYYFVEKVGKLPYNVGDIVAVAQSYKAIELDPKTIFKLPIKGSKTKGVMQCEASYTPGWTNKMFVRPELMPHNIRITNVRVENLQDIGDVDCLAEGIEFSHKAQKFYVNRNPMTGSCIWLGDTPRDAYAALIDRISGKGTWENNPYVFVYDFEVVK